ncbi:NAD(P)-dependent oxidoreductase [Actinopolymorpha sp. B9G3]|uniref:NAD-dependent epimerase/dehydratase family protein n=1 Tax=Actinopolymorpha sp. B9G3 TaxID=3158970 RepID=UPI0032D95CCD
MPKPCILLTGAAGGVGQLLLPGLVESYDVVLTDRVPAPGMVTGDLADPDFLAKVTSGVDSIIHLAANPDAGATWDELRTPNVDVVASILATEVPRVVLASSVHVMGAYAGHRQVPVDPDWAPAPCCAYGATKALAEALARVRAYQTGRSVVALRLGATSAEPGDVTALAGWLGPADLQQLVVRALEADVTFAVCHGVSANTRSDWLVRNPIGYEPVLDSEDYADQVPVDDYWALCSPGGRTPR